MDDISRAKARTLMLVLRTIEEEVLKLANEEKKGSAPNDTTGDDLEQALRAIATALDHLRVAAGNGEGTEQRTEAPLGLMRPAIPILGFQRKENGKSQRGPTISARVKAPDFVFDTISSRGS